MLMLRAMPMPMLYVHAVDPQTEVLWTSTFPVFCKGDVNRASRNAVDSLMAMITELMV
jgi:hypothetical protein